MKERETDDILLITRYFDLDLSEKEMIEFDKRILQEPSFAHKVKAYQESSKLVDKSHINREQQQRTNKWKQLIAESPTSTKQTSRKWIAGIAATILILISSWFFMFPMQENNLDQLAQQAWDKKVGFDNYLVRNNIVEPSKKTILSAYKSFEKKEYELAINTLRKYNASQLYYEDALLIRALSIYKTGNTTIALHTLDSLSNLPSKRLSKEALWYKGLIYLDTKDLESAKKYLEIPNDNTSEIRLKETSGD